jgi:hypothetical protein
MSQKRSFSFKCLETRSKNIHTYCHCFESIVIEIENDDVSVEELADLLRRQRFRTFFVEEQMNAGRLCGR